MTKTGKLERDMQALDALAEAPPPDFAKRLAAALAGAAGLVAAKAARLAIRFEMGELAPDLAACFWRHLEDGGKSDQGCMAKTAAVEGLSGFGWEKADLYLAGLRHVQMEPAWGGPEDSAGDLRAQSLAALARVGHPDLFFEIEARLFTDRLRMPRVAAVRILGDLPRQESELLLRAKLHAGDEDSTVLGECLAALMRIAPSRSLEFVAAYLRSGDPAIAEEAALALGESRLPAAFDALMHCWEERFEVESRKRLILPIGLTRLPEAREFLKPIAKGKTEPLARAAKEALRLFKEEKEE